MTSDVCYILVHALSIVFLYVTVLFDNIEQDNIQAVEQLLEVKPMSELQMWVLSKIKAAF